MWWRRRETESEAAPPDVPARWRPIVADCDQLLGELAALVASAPDGAVRDRLEGVRAGVADSVTEAVAAANRAGEIDRLAGTVDVVAVTDAYKRARRATEEAGRLGEVPEDMAARLDSLRRQHESGQRLLNAVERTGEQLVVVRAQLKEIVLGAAELALGSSQDGLEASEQQASALAADVSALRDALADLR